MHRPVTSARGGSRSVVFGAPPARPTRLGEREVHVWTAKLDSIPEPADVGILGERERERASRLRDPADRHRYVAAHAMLRRLLGEYLGASPEALQFDLGADGKPELDRGSGSPTLSFNLSHSDCWAAVALAKSLPVGVDVEDIRLVPAVDDVARLVLSRTEQAVLERMEGASRRRSFLTAWVCKEAVLKAIGRGLGDGAREVEVPGNVLEAGADAAATRFDFLADRGLGWRVRSLDLPGACVGAVAAPDLGWSLRCLSYEPGSRRSGR